MKAILQRVTEAKVEVDSKPWAKSIRVFLFFSELKTVTPKKRRTHLPQKLQV